MASVRTHPRSPNWILCYTLPDGRRTNATSKLRATPRNRSKALAMAEKIEDAARRKLSEAQARRLIADIYEAINGDELPSKTAREFLTEWQQTAIEKTSPRTAQAYGQVAREFLAALGDRADRDVAQITRGDVERYRDAVFRRTSRSTANKALKYLRVALGAAWKQGLLERNPAQQVDVIRLRAAQANERRPFTLVELKAVLEHASPEWKGIILFGLYTGQRLGDIARLTWANVDTTAGDVRFTTGKTGRRMHLPLAKPLQAHLATMPAADDPAAPLFPEAHRVASTLKDRSRLSQQFHEILVAAGLATARTKLATDATGDGRRRKRTLSPITFHSLRHTATSLLKVAGVAEAVARDIIGHDSEAVSRHYTHIEADAKRQAIDRLPDVSSST